jgi:lipoprotein-anchoring transpeptidase ErfK/SrfK
MGRAIRILIGIFTITGLVGAGSLSEPVLGSAHAASVPQVAAAPAAVMVSAKPASRRLPKRCRTKGRVLCIDKGRDKLYYVRKGKIISSMDARFGCASTRTREGTFRVFRKRRYTVSDLYHTPMPYSMFFSGGQAVHYSSDFARRGYAGCSHGCVNIRAKAKLRYVFNRIRLGDRVVVYRS